MSVKEVFRSNSTAERDPNRGFDSHVRNRRTVVRIRGIVQGVGFRPYIFQLAGRYGLDGWVCNQSDGVEIEVAGRAEQIEQFLQDIPVEVPPLARITHMEVEERPYLPMESFRIVESRSARSRSTLISPDMCTCADCLAELFDPADRRHRYPFINCTNCGPRYTIIQDIPYDRDKTTMARFEMCSPCLAEYHDPANRRFHAQPNACSRCGPRVWLEDSHGARISEKDDALRGTVRRLDEGAIVAVKGLGGFHLAVAATDEKAVERLRRRKIREEKPFAVMFADVDGVKCHCRMSGQEEALLTSPQRPIVLLTRRDDPEGIPIASGVAPRNRYLGAFLPYTPLHYLLFDGAQYRSLVMTSGNQSDEPIVMENEEARVRLQGIADFFLFHDRDIYMRTDDSVTRMLAGMPRPMRRARGYVPVPVFLREPVPAVLGTGAELKNTICLTRGREAFLSQHIGDLENLETLRSFELTLSHLERILEVEPECIVHDLHPDYLSTQWAMEQKGILRFAVQHHHAHIASVMAERQLEGPVLGVALDGTGFGPDGTIWGGEILRVDGAHFERLGHFRQVPLPGGNAAVREPWRMALSFLRVLDPDPRHAFSDILERWPSRNVSVLLRMLERGVNSPLTSSCGRLFDAVSSLAGLRDVVTYEGQAAVELEQALVPGSEAYEGEVRSENGVWIVDPLPMIAGVVEDVRNRCSRGIISSRFHNGLVHLLGEAVRRIASETGLTRVGLSGGVFQNAFLLEHIEEHLRNMGFDVYSHVEVPANDACIALGQAFAGAAMLASGKPG
jgi:hydrogenase maturation protein HypF